MKQRAFTLMELMIVIVIIGILSAVGMVMFGGQAEKAKIAVTKSNHKNAVKYIKYEAMKCQMGALTILPLTKNKTKSLTCAGLSAKTIVDYIGDHGNFNGEVLDFKNPYWPAPRGYSHIWEYGFGSGGDGQYIGGTVAVGFLGNNPSTNTITISTCVVPDYNSACATEDILSSKIIIE